MPRVETLEQYFTSSNGWQIIEVSAGDLDIRETVEGEIQKCIDRRYGVTMDGYDPVKVPLSPGWMGGLDGIEAFLRISNPLKRAKEAARRVRALGFEPATHGDLALGKDGCAWKRVRKRGLVPGVNPAFSQRLEEFIEDKVNVHHVTLREAQFHARGFVMNDRDKTTVMPEDGKYYVNDIWFGRQAGIKEERFLPVIAAVGQLVLPREDRRLFVVAS